jgi:hypothetical protein
VLVVVLEQGRQEQQTKAMLEVTAVMLIITQVVVAVAQEALAATGQEAEVTQMEYQEELPEQEFHRR